MEYIVYDLEWNQPYFNEIQFLRQCGMPVTGEIIQIGAVKVNEKLEVIDTFNIIVKPLYLQTMNKHVSSLTGIHDCDIAFGVPFIKAIRHFQQWCGTEAALLSWGCDDWFVLIENMRLHDVEKQWSFQWYDAQSMYAHAKHGNYDQMALSKALEECHILTELDAHNALHDARYTVRLLREINFQKELAHYDREGRIHSTHVMFPSSESFVVFDGFRDKKSVFNDKRVTRVLCPECRQPLLGRQRERTTGSKFLALAKCPDHGEYAIQWRVQKYSGPKQTALFYCAKNVTQATDEIRTHYIKKAMFNAERAAKYEASQQRKQAARMAMGEAKE